MRFLPVSALALVLIGACVVVLPLASAQTSDPTLNWTKRLPATSPSARNGYAMTYDVARNRVVLFGGVAGAGPPFFDDTWEWDGREWVARVTDVHPSGRNQAGMAYDEARERIVLFGGSGQVDGEWFYDSDTWEWDGVTWTKVESLPHPPGLWAPALMYDSTLNQTVLFGGQTLDGDVQSDTWSWDGISWRKLDSSLSPPPRNAAAFAYDSVRGRGVMFGGSAGDGSLMGDTWEWDGADWIERLPATSPSARRPAMAYDSARERIVIFGGDGPWPQRLGDTWDYDGSTWARMSPSTSPVPRGGISLAFDSARSVAVLFGGINEARTLLDQTWELGEMAAPTVEPSPEPSSEPTAEPTSVPPDVIFLPLNLRHATIEELPPPVEVPDQCAQHIAGPPGPDRPSIIDLSDAHAAIRFFGTADRYSTVDQALTEAFADTASSQWPQ